MLFRFLRQARAIVMFGALFALTACPRTASKEEKALRAELRKALDEQNYERAADLARRHLKLKPMDNGTWDRLVRAQFGLLRGRPHRMATPAAPWLPGLVVAVAAVERRGVGADPDVPGRRGLAPAAGA